MNHHAITLATAALLLALQPPSPMQRHAILAAVEANQRLSITVLWHDHIPAAAARIGATAGPALAQLQASARQRRIAGIRVRVRSDHWQLTHIHPERAGVVGLLVAVERVQPYQLRGGPLGAPITLHEHAHLHLRRNRRRYLVWKATP